MVTTEDILKAYFDCRKNKRRSESAICFELDFEHKCCMLAEEINSRQYEIGPSTAFIVTRPKKREVFAADFRDRVVHHWLIQRLEPLFEEYFIHDTYNCRKGKGTQYGIDRLYQKIKKISENYTRDCWVAKFDMRGFFMSIHKPTLWKMLKAFIETRYEKDDIGDVLWIAEKIVMHCPENNCILRSDPKSWKDLPEDKSLFTCGKDYGLPIGNLTSQMLANFYLTVFDLIMLCIFGEGYGRYVDDFFIICLDKSRILAAINPIKHYLKNVLHIMLHPNKIYLQHYSKGIKFIGGVIKRNLRYVANRTVDKLFTLIDYLNSNPLKYTVEEAACRLNSYFGFLRHSNSYSIRKRAALMLNSEWWKHIYIRGHYEVVTVCIQDRTRYNIFQMIKK